MPIHYAATVAKSRTASEDACERSDELHMSVAGRGAIFDASYGRHRAAAHGAVHSHRVNVRVV